MSKKKQEQKADTEMSLISAADKQELVQKEAMVSALTCQHLYCLIMALWVALQFNTNNVYVYSMFFHFCVSKTPANLEVFASHFVR